MMPRINFEGHLLFRPNYSSESAEYNMDSLQDLFSGNSSNGIFQGLVSISLKGSEIFRQYCLVCFFCNGWD